MGDVIVLHHALGRTPGVDALAARLGATTQALGQGNGAVAAPDLYDGRRFDDLAAGVAHLEGVGIDAVLARAERAIPTIAPGTVLVGISLGALVAQHLAVTRAGVRGVVLVSGCVPVEALAAPWPRAVAATVHGMTADPWFVDEGDLESARALVDRVDEGRLVLHPGDRHLFVDEGHPDWDGDAAAAVVTSVLDLVGR